VGWTGELEQENWKKKTEIRKLEQEKTKNGGGMS